MSFIKDNAWERIQQKTFTGWVNSHLRKRGQCIEDILTDFSDGLKLITLLECISNETFPYKYEKRVRMRLMKVNNINFCLKFIEDHGVRLPGTGAEAIVDGNKPMTLGLIWTLILRFQIQDISLEELSAKEALLLWCQKKTAGYDGVDVKNFHFSFQDGLAFCALIHRHRPDLLDYDSLDHNDKKGNLNKAFEVAEKHLDIPSLLDADDIVDVAKPDERSIITYVSLYYHAFASSQKAETAGRRIAKVLDFTASVEEMKSDYLRRAEVLKNWIDGKNGEFSSVSFDNTLEGVQGQIASYKDYRRGEKDAQAQEKLELEALYNAFQTKLSVNNRPPFSPPEGLSPKELDSSWGTLEKTEHAYFLQLRNELRRMKKITALVHRFKLKAEKVNDWSAKAQDRLASAELGDNISTVSANIKNHEAFEGVLSSQQSSVDVLRSWKDELESLNYNDINDINNTLSNVQDNVNSVQDASKKRSSDLADRLVELQRLEALQLNFAKKAIALSVWLDNSDDILNEPIEVETVEAIEEMVSKFESLADGYSNKEGDLKEVGDIAGSCSEAGIPEDQFSEISWSDLQQKWSAVGQSIGARRDALNAEKAKQEENEKLRVEFAQAATALSAECEKQSDAIDALSGEVEEQLTGVRGIIEQTQANQGALDSLNQVNDALDAAGVDDNPHTEITIDVAKRQVATVARLAKEKEQALNQALASNQGSSLTPEQVSEYRDCFNHFDKDSSGTLNRLELGACLRSLGEDVDLEEQGGKLDQILQSIDSDGDGSVQFDEFLSYMEKVAADSDTPEQIKDAFKCIAGDKDFVTEADLRSVLPEEKVAYCLANMQPYEGVEGGYDYSTFTDNLYQ